MVLVALLALIAHAGNQTTLDRAKALAHGGQYHAAWHELGLRDSGRAVDHATRCASNSTGAVRTFFRRTECRSLDRELLSVSDTRGNTAAVSIVWVTMSGTSAAQQLKTLVDRDGTGDLLVFGGRQFDGKYYSSRPSGATVVIAEVEPRKGHPAAATLRDIAAVAAEYPPPR